MSRSSSDVTDKYTYRLTWSEADRETRRALRGAPLSLVARQDGHGGSRGDQEGRSRCRGRHEELWRAGSLNRLRRVSSAGPLTVRIPPNLHRRPDDLRGERGAGVSINRLVSVDEALRSDRPDHRRSNTERGPRSSSSAHAGRRAGQPARLPRAPTKPSARCLPRRRGVRRRAIEQPKPRMASSRPASVGARVSDELGELEAVGHDGRRRAVAGSSGSRRRRERPIGPGKPDLLVVRHAAVLALLPLFPVVPSDQLD